MRRSNLEIVVELVNHSRPGAARFAVLPAAGRACEHCASAATALTGRILPFDAGISRHGDELFE